MYSLLKVRRKSFADSSAEYSYGTLAIWYSKALYSCQIIFIESNTKAKNYIIYVDYILSFSQLLVGILLHWKKKTFVAQHSYVNYSIESSKVLHLIPSDITPA